MNKPVVLYARISVSLEESVSVERQLESGRKYAEARGWTVVGEFVDEGVSASDHRPDKRKGWSALLAHSEPFEAVIIWKVDRLARKVLDFLEADRDLQARGAACVAVEQALDMTTAMGRMVAQVLAIFAEYEAGEISARVAAARTHLIKNGRAVGGTVPYGWKNVPNPDGPGKVLAIDPERISWVRAMVERAQRGDTVYSIAQWLDSAGAPLPKGNQSNRKSSDGWKSSTVEGLLRNPVLAGATSYNPGHQKKARGGELLRDERGLPVVNPATAIMTLAEWRALVDSLDNRDSHQSRPRAMKAKTNGLLSGLVWCADPRHEEPLKMWRGRYDSREGYSCSGPGGCHQTITNFQDILINHFLTEKGDWMRWSKVVDVYEGGAEDLPEVEHRLVELDELIRSASDRAERNRLREEQDALLDERDRLRALPGTVVEKWNPDDATFGELWARAEDDPARRAVLEDAFSRVLVTRGPIGRSTPEKTLNRLAIEWLRPDEVGPRPLEDEAV